MEDLIKMAESHLLNVEREIETLRGRQDQLQQSIEQLQAYLVDGAAVIEKHKKLVKQVEDKENSEKQVFNWKEHENLK